MYNNGMKIIVNDLQDTQNLAYEFADKLSGNEIILLSGDLGAGKTTFTKALALALGIDEIVTSPTFAFMKEYFGRYKLSHYDMYRAETEEELSELGISENLYEDGICVIEWNKFHSFPEYKKVIKIGIKCLDSGEREFDIQGGDYE